VTETRGRQGGGRCPEEGEEGRGSTSAYLPACLQVCVQWLGASGVMGWGGRMDRSIDAARCWFIPSASTRSRIRRAPGVHVRPSVRPSVSFAEHNTSLHCATRGKKHNKPNQTKKRKRSAGTRRPAASPPLLRPLRSSTSLRCAVAPRGSIMCSCSTYYGRGGHTLYRRKRTDGRTNRRDRPSIGGGPDRFAYRQTDQTDRQTDLTVMMRT